MLEGKTINVIKPIGGTVAGQQKQYELWIQGATITIENPEQVKVIDKVLKEARKYNLNEKEYLTYMIEEEGILN